MNVTPVGFAGTVAAVASGVGREVGGGSEGGGNEAVGTAEAAGGVAASSGAVALWGELGAVLDGIALGLGVKVDGVEPAPAEQAATARQAAIANERPRVGIRTGIMLAPVWRTHP